MQITTSKYSVSETAKRLIDALNKRNIKVFAHISHSQAARDADLEMRDEELIIFGDPKTGTNLMLEQPKIGIALPLKMLMWLDAEKKTQVGYELSQQLASQYQIKQNIGILGKMDTLLATLATEISQ